MRVSPLVDEVHIEQYKAAGLYDASTLWEWQTMRDPGSPAVVDPELGEVTAGELVAESAGLAAAFAADGVGAGDVVMLQLPNGYEFVLVHTALTYLGAATFPVPAAYRMHEIVDLCSRAQVRGFVGSTRAWGSVPPVDREELAAKVPSLQASWWGGDGSLRDLARAGHPPIEPGPAAPDDLTVVLSTSGTTGEPKLIAHTHVSIGGGHLRGLAQAMELTSDDVILMSLPLGHAGGLMNGVRLSALLGATLVLQDKWVAAQAADLIARYKATWTITTPPFLFDLIRLPAETREAMRSMRTFVVSGAPVLPSLASEAMEALPWVRLSPGWGMSETGLSTSVRHSDPPEKIVDSDGRPHPGWEVRVVDGDGKEVPTGESGELECRGPGLFCGYLGRDDVTAASWDDGWFRTGDLARMDADGFIRLSGRVKDLIIRGGVNISAVEVEDLVRRHPGVRDAAVVGAPDLRLGERICAFVVPEGDAAPTVAELGEFLAGLGVARPKHPEIIVTTAELPRTAIGKVQKYVLRQQIAAAGSSSA